MNSVVLQDSTQKYSEHIPVSRQTGVFLSILLTVALCIFVIPLYMVLSTGPDKMMWAIVIFVLCFTLVYLVLSKTYGVRIKVSKKRSMDWSKKDVLHVRGTQRGEQVYILLDDIESVEIMNYDVLSDEDFPETDGASTHIYQVSGFSGKCLVVSFRYKTLVSTTSKTSTQIIPSRNPEQLARRLGF